jgi:hypothetical protein
LALCEADQPRDRGGARPGGGCRLTARLDHLPGWRCLYSDDIAGAHVREDENLRYKRAIFLPGEPSLKFYDNFFETIPDPDD